ncbi:hypothetical protein [Streptomyces melanogenes]|uniref:hypothetical protein n=1 Tax=Streptomyces melanogenes TaxID=67326 RepID=UPI00167EBA28|nr:hypothetical protein [Streptomyces melanogenes]GGP89310.1 hypothetical protein GCM10010278_79680 [Streptomyces melanogenes]
MTSSDQAGADRRGFLVGAAAVMVGGWWTASGSAYAEPSELPLPGETIRCVSTARGVVLRTLVGSGSVDVDCAIALRVEADPTDGLGRTRRLRVLDHRMRGRSTEFGEISIVQEPEHPRSLPPSTIRRLDDASPRYALRLVCSQLEMQVERVHADLLERVGLPLGLGEQSATLVTTGPLVLENDHLSSWRFQHHTLASRRKVELAFADLPAMTVATIEPFTIDAMHA